MTAPLFQRILVPVDGSATSTKGLKEAIDLARLSGGRIRLLHVVDDLPLLTAGAGAFVAEAVAVLRDAGEQVLAAARHEVEDAGLAVDTALFDSLEGRLCDRVAQQAEEWQADLVVIGTHGRRGVRRLFLGSDAEQVLRTSAVPVLLVRGQAGDPD